MGFFNRKIIEALPNEELKIQHILNVLGLIEKRKLGLLKELEDFKRKVGGTHLNEDAQRQHISDAYIYKELGRLSEEAEEISDAIKRIEHKEAKQIRQKLKEVQESLKEVQKNK
jgi:vacuolar-type H+-ATPase subunit I/STV1